MSIDSALPADGVPLSETKRRLLERFRRGDAPPRSDRGAIPRRTGAPFAPLSHGQHQIWLHSQLAPDLPLYNEPLTVHRSGPLDVGALEWSLGEIVRRHEAWRTTVQAVDGEPVLVVHEPPAVALPVTDLRRLPAGRRGAEALRLATAEARRPFDLARGPLVRFLLVRTGDEEHRLFLTLHQIIFDGVSMYSVFLPELTALYEARVQGRPSPLPELDVQYGDFSAWQRDRVRPEDAVQHAEYWRRHLAGAPTVLELPADRPRLPVQTFRGAQPTFALSPQLSGALKELSRRSGATLFMTLFAAFAVLLYRYTGQEDILIGTVATRRGRPELERLLGFFLNTLVLRARLAEDLSFADLLARVRDATLEGLGHGDVPIEDVVQSLAPDRDPSRNPLFQVMFVLEPPLPPPPPGWNLTQMDVDTGISRVDLYLEADDRPEGIVGRIRYGTDLFDAATIDRLLERFRVLLEGIVADPGRKLSALPVLTRGERDGGRAHLPELRARPPAGAFTSRDVEQTLSARFQQQAARHPGRTAVQEEGRAWTYEALDRAADAVGAAVSGLLRDAPAPVALVLDHDATMAAGIFGVLRAGGIYVPLDPSHPAERLARIVTDAAPAAFVTSGRHDALVRALAGDRPVLDADEIVSRPAGAWRQPKLTPDHHAYILYTSGSTGQPKGVLQNHRNVLHFIRAYANNLGLSADDRLTLVSSYTVDAAVMDVFGALLTGATLCPVDVRAAGLLGLRDRLRRDRVSVYHSTPTLFRHLVAACGGEVLAPSLRLVVLGGEEVRREDLEAFRRHVPSHCLLVNGLGPTESTVALQQFFDTASRVERTSVPVGRPVEETEVLLLSPGGEPGQIHGEIAIRSRYVALGYWRQPELTASSFLVDPGGGSQRIYRTGDMGDLLADGTIGFAGRRDAQVKVRGFRIELGEIEAALARHPGVREAGVAVHRVASGEPRLVAHWVAAADTPPSDEALRRFLRDKVPDYMLPAAFVRVDALPLTASGKLDRRALADREPETPHAEPVFVPPRDGVELRLARLWQDVLGTGPVGRTDHFFDLGGHSLLAVRLFAEIERTFGLRIPLATLFEAPTLEQLAAVVRERGRSASWSSLVPLQTGGGRAPFFGVHGHSGEILFYRDLCRRLGPDQPFFALQARGLDGQPPLASIEAMAAHYVGEMRGAQPQGPYALGGYCLGAFIAFEMAQQLRAAGEEVSLLAFFVGYTPGPRGLLGGARRLAGRIGAHLGRAQALPLAEGWRYLVRKCGDAAQALAKGATSLTWRLLRRLLDGAPELPPWMLRNVEEMNLHAARSYAPKMYPGKLTVFLSGDTPAGFRLDPAKDLDGLLARDMEVVRVPGTTDTMMKEPHVAALGAALASRISGPPATGR